MTAFATEAWSQPAVATSLVPRFAPDLRSYDSDQGLPQNSVTAMVQDRDGYLWIGTYGGLVRFDGHNFRTYGSRSDDGPPSDRISALLEGSHGRLWIGTENAGVGRLEPDGHFVRPDGCGKACRIRRLLRTGDGSVIAVGDDGAFRLDDALNAMPIASSTLTQIRSAAVDAQGGLWLADDRRILPPNGNAAFMLPDQSRIARFLANRNGVWVMSDALWRIGSSGARQALAQQPFGSIFSMAIDADDALWIGTEIDGVWRTRNDNAAPERVAGLEELRNAVLVPDRDGALWIGGDGQGLRRWSPAFVGGLGGPGTTLATPIMAVLPNGPGDLWIGAFCGGLYRHRNDAELLPVALPDSEDQCIWSLATDRHGGVVVGHDHGRIAWLDHDGKPLRHWRVPGEERIRALHVDERGELWVGGSLGLFRGPLDGDIQPVTDYGRAEVSTIRPARDGGLWIGSDAGVVRWQQNRALRRIGVAEGLGSRFVRALFEDERGVLWIGTYGGGLHRLDGERLTHFTTADGLAEDFVSCVQPDARGRLWLAGNRGLSRVDRAALDDFDGRLLSPTLYTRSDGMPTSETNGGSGSTCAADARGRLLVALISGLAVVDPDSIRSTSVQPGPRVDLVEARVDGRPVDWHKGLSMATDDATLALHYAAPSLAGGSRLQFRYRLDGDWIEVGQTREILLSALPWGNWSLELAARLDGGPWTAKPTRLLVSHPPPWHQDLRLRLAAVITMLLVMALGVRARTLALRERARHLDQLVGARTAELANANRQLAELVRTDPLTGIINRRGFTERLTHDWHEASRTGQPLALLVVDVDAFKAYNDHYGHPAGDACLQRIAAIFDAELAVQPSQRSLLARIGGEEFAVLLPGVQSLQARALAEALRRAVTDSTLPHAHSPVADCVTISVGVASMTAYANHDPLSLVERADAALYRAKAAGRNRVVADSDPPAA